MNVVYTLPDVRLTAGQLAKLHRDHPESFVCQECGIDLILPDLICGWCAIERFGEQEPDLGPAMVDPVNIPDGWRPIN